MIRTVRSMKPPFFRITAICDRCDLEFYQDKKRCTYVSTSGREEQRQALVCPQCRCWAKIMKIETVKQWKENRP